MTSHIDIGSAGLHAHVRPNSYRTSTQTYNEPTASISRCGSACVVFDVQQHAQPQHADELTSHHSNSRAPDLSVELDCAREQSTDRDRVYMSSFAHTLQFSYPLKLMALSPSRRQFDHHHSGEQHEEKKPGTLCIIRIIQMVSYA